MIATTSIRPEADARSTEPPWIAEVVSDARHGDELAFGRLYSEFAPRVFRFCAFRVAQPADAEDMTQQTFMKAIEALPRYEERGLPFAAWLFRIARNIVIDHERARRTDLDLDDVLGRGAEATTDVAVSRADDRDLLIRALRGLTRSQREVLAYRFFADLSARETGLLLGRNEATVRALQARAIGALRRNLASQSQPDPGSGRPTPEKQAIRSYAFHPLSQRS